ncbi:aldo/keto reductase [Ruminococcaceae bacterium OttesenSCG-928-L11]|nr:aldo/keto reductase [Ruminococcaceae bacterium OttesenSCG-928-L11]
MQYVPFGKTGISVSRLGFGCMRFPSRTENGVTVFDEDESIRMMQRAMDLGVNYFDTAPGYCETKSEIIVGKALKNCRDKVYLSTKNPIENASGDDYEKRLETSLTKLDTDYIDFYHFWGISLETFNDKVMAPDGPMARAIKLKEQGVIRNISFSFHDKPGNMAEIIRRGEGVFSSLLCQYNLLDEALVEDILFAKEQGLGVVIMGPVGGGRLGAPSQVIQDLLPGKVKSSAEAAMRFVFDNPNIHIALSGMSSMDMVEENAAIADSIAPLTADERSRISDMMQENKRLADLYCTGCNYCMPCPQEINIPEIFKMMNYHKVYSLTDYAKKQYAEIGKSPWMKYENAAACVDCGLCEEKCPQKLQIREQLRNTHEALA